jgi:mono/diheme cytochrome c family protein
MKRLRASLVPLSALALLIAAPLNGVIAGDDDGEDPIGLTEYELACMSCHGLYGKGDGPKARTLATMPADLTRLSQRNGGIFPTRDVFDMIDGRGVIPAHGNREMPIWGERYRKTGDPGEDPAAVEGRASALIEALVAYIETIQVK